MSTELCGTGTGFELREVCAVFTALLVCVVLREGCEAVLRSESRPPELGGNSRAGVPEWFATAGAVGSVVKEKARRELLSRCFAFAWHVLPSLDVVMFPAAATKLR
jgi:hypothetical protein